jgi:flagellar protein FlaG
MAAAGKVENNLHNLFTDDGNGARPTSEDVEGAVKNANHFLEQISRELRFERSETDGQIVVQVKDQKTGSVIRQFPSEEMLQIAKDIERMTGLLFKDSA